MAKRLTQPSGEADFRAAMDKLYTQKAKSMGKKADDPAVQAAVNAQIQKVAGVFNPHGDVAAQVAARRKAIIQLVKGKPKPPAPKGRAAKGKAKGRATGKAAQPPAQISADKMALIGRIKREAADTIAAGGSRSDAVRKAWATRRARGSAKR